MTKKSKKNENTRELLRKVKKKAKERKESLNYLKLTQEEEKHNKCYLEAHKIMKENNEMLIEDLLDMGYVFRPEEGILLDYHLRNKIMNKTSRFCPIKEVSVYESHPQALIGKSRVRYFFTRGHSNAIQLGTSVQGHWVFGKKEDVIYQGGKVGVKQVVEYCEADHKSEYKIIQYQLDPAPDDTKADLWFVCKMYNDAHGGC